MSRANASDRTACESTLVSTAPREPGNCRVLLAHPHPPSRPSPNMRSLRRFAASTTSSRRCSSAVSGGRTEPRCHLPLDCASGPSTPTGARSELTPTTLLRRCRILEAAAKGARSPAVWSTSSRRYRTYGRSASTTYTRKRTDQLSAPACIVRFECAGPRRRCVAGAGPGQTRALRPAVFLFGPRPPLLFGPRPPRRAP